MGVMLSLDRHRPVRGRRRAQHARHPDGQGRGQALAIVRRYEAPASARLLSRLARAVLARRGREAGDFRGGRPDDAPGDRAWSHYPGMSVACLLGECRDEAGREICDVGGCEHDCHRDAAARGAAPGAGTAPAA
jgi:hypothetical protein